MFEHLKFECEVLTTINAKLSDVKLPRLPDYTALDFRRH